MVCKVSYAHPENCPTVLEIIVGRVCELCSARKLPYGVIRKNLNKKVEAFRRLDLSTKA